MMNELNETKEQQKREVVSGQVEPVVMHLLACPFCGPDAELILSDLKDDENADDDYIKYVGGRFYIICIECGMKTRGHKTKEAAIETFNTRYDFPKSP